MSGDISGTRIKLAADVSSVPGILFEDEHLLVVNKPAGWNTHSPASFAGEGIYDWLRHREPRWATLAIIHRLDKETSGLLVFGKTPSANRALTEQFMRRTVRKEYRLVTRHPVKFHELTVRTGIERRGDHYVAVPQTAGGEVAETCFTRLDDSTGFVELRAVPRTGRTHQIRVHAAARGFPILGDVLYGGEPAARLWLHAERLTFQHPATAEPFAFHAPVNFALAPARLLREAVIDPAETNAWRMIHGAGELGERSCPPDDAPDFYVDRLGDFLLAQSGRAPGLNQREFLRAGQARFGLRGVYHKLLNRRIRGASANDASPQRLFGEPAPEWFTLRENGVTFEVSFNEGYSVGLFLDQRDNRRRLLVNHVAAGFPLFAGDPSAATVLNVFAYTCGFSVCAALAGAHTTSLDLSKRSLEWGRRNFALNGLNANAHDFIFGDAFDWLRRLTKKDRAFDVVLLDPPTFSTSKSGGTFRAEQDFGRLAAAAVKLVRPGGVLFASTNAARLAPEQFLAGISHAISEGGRRVVRQHYAPQPPDFPVSRAEPAYLKTVWLRLD